MSFFFFPASLKASFKYSSSFLGFKRFVFNRRAHVATLLLKIDDDDAENEARSGRENERLSASRFLFNSISLRREIRSTALVSSQKWSETRSNEKNGLCELVLMTVMALYTSTRQTWFSQSYTQQVEHVNHHRWESIPKIVHVGRERFKII